MIPISVTVGPLTTASDEAIAASQSPTGTSFTLTADPVVLDAPRQIVITSAGDDSGISFVVTGTTFGGQSITETLVGTNSSTVTSVLMFATVSSIVATGAIAGAVKAGTTDVATTRWIRFDDFAPNYISIQGVADGTVDYTVQYTLDDPNSPFMPIAPVDVTWVTSDDPDVVNATGDATSNFIFAPTFARVLFNTGTGSVRATFLQSFGGV